MAKVEIKEPNIITIEFYQENTDEDYGTCLWARFVLDTENYDLHITSDCGNYGYGWNPTPKTESFLKLVSRMESEYLLSKISDQSIVDTEATYERIKEFFEYHIGIFDKATSLEKLGIDMDSIYTACTYSNETEVVQSIRSEIEYTDINDEIDDFDLYECIYKDYSAQSKKIGDIFEKFIKPKVREILKAGENGEV